MELLEPTWTEVIELNRTTLRLWHWGDPDDQPVICLHGAYDHGRMWDEIAPQLADRGFHVVAPDLRGHGDSGRLNSGHLWLASALDIALLARHLGAPVGLVGHSFGGGQALYVAAIWPHLVRWAVNIDWLGPSAATFEEEADLAKLATEGFAAVERVDRTPLRRYPSLADMAERRRRINPRLSDEWVDHLTLHGALETEGGWIWKADPVFSVGFPGDFDLAILLAQYEAVECPVLVLTGSEPDTWSDLPADEMVDRVAAIGARHRVIEGAGHYVHCEQPVSTMDEIDAFLAEVDR